VTRRTVLRSCTAWSAVAVLVTSVAACGSASPGPAADRGAAIPPTGSTTGATAAATATRTPSLAEPSLAPPASRSATRPPVSAVQGGSTAHCSVPSGVRASQVVVVQSSGSSATVRACRRSGSHYVLALGPYPGHVGLRGVSAAKREGDLRTPAGVFPLRGGFGRYGNPGLALGWFRVDSSDVWVDDPSSSLYNTHQRTPAHGRWDSAEPLDNAPVYNYAQVIGYNESRTPGRGSAIFLHVDHGGGTAGCVSVPTSNLLSILRWERAGAVIAIS
jgi:L,D-peptidoglycan transpeptidase YkuD (ErfK/YbiS/YcfS/YnhG family)